jgi:hypothetical protein
MNIHKKITIFAVLLGLIGFCDSVLALHTVREHNNRIYILDRYAEEWDITEAVTLGFKPEKFQYGIGRNAFTPLDDKKLTNNDFFVSSNLRVIGIAKDDEAHAYSVPKLSRHEIANSAIANTPIVVGY